MCFKILSSIDVLPSDPRNSLGEKSVKHFLGRGGSRGSHDGALIAPGGVNELLQGFDVFEHLCAYSSSAKMKIISERTAASRPCV